MTATNDRRLDQASIERLEAAMRWLITEATPRLFADPESGKAINKQLIAQHGVSSYLVPGIDDDSGSVRFMPKSRGLYYDVSLLESTTHEGWRYEYWVVFRTSKDWATLTIHDCRFIVARSETTRSRRSIVENMRTFFHLYGQAERPIFDLDYRNPQLRARLRADEFPECYKAYPDLVR